MPWNVHYRNILDSMTVDGKAFCLYKPVRPDNLYEIEHTLTVVIVPESHTFTLQSGDRSFILKVMTLLSCILSSARPLKN